MWKKVKVYKYKKIPHESENWFAFSKIGITVSPGNSSRFRVSHSQSNYDSRSCGTKGAKTNSRRRCSSIANTYCCYYVGVWSEKNDTLTSVEMYRKYLVMLYILLYHNTRCFMLLLSPRVQNRKNYLFHNWFYTYYSQCTMLCAALMIYIFLLFRKVVLLNNDFSITV